MLTLISHFADILLGAVAVCIVAYLRRRLTNRELRRMFGDAIGLKQSRVELLRFRSAMDRSGDLIYIIDPETMKFVDATQSACTRAGYTRDEILKMGPPDIVMMTRQELQAIYDAVIAAGTHGVRTESRSQLKDGSISIVDQYRRAVRCDGRWLIVSEMYNDANRETTYAGN